MDILEYEDLEEGVYDSIIAMLLQGTILPGDKLNQLVLARKLSASRTPINAVLSHLEALMIVEKRPRRGYFVPKYSSAETGRLFPLFVQNGNTLLEELLKSGEKIKTGKLDSFIQKYADPAGSSGAAELLYTFFDIFASLNVNRFLKNTLMGQTVILMVSGGFHSIQVAAFFPVLIKLTRSLETNDRDAAFSAFTNLTALIQDRLFPRS